MAKRSPQSRGKVSFRRSSSQLLEANHRCVSNICHSVGNALSMRMERSGTGRPRIPEDLFVSVGGKVWTVAEVSWYGEDGGIRSRSGLVELSAGVSHLVRAGSTRLELCRAASPPMCSSVGGLAQSRLCILSAPSTGTVMH
jgi:hypothetical protein